MDVSKYIEEKCAEFAKACAELKEKILKNIIKEDDPNLWKDRIKFVTFENDIEKEWLVVDEKYIGYFIIEQYHPMSLYKKLTMNYVFYMLIDLEK